MAGMLSHIYSNSTPWLQNFGLSIYGYYWRYMRTGGNFKKFVAVFREREDYLGREWQTYQSRQLQKLLSHAVNHVPFYKKSYQRKVVRDIAQFDLEQLLKLPLLEKEDIRSNPDAFIAENVNPRNLFSYHTSGTTGTPLTIKVTKDFHRIWSAAYEVRVRRWAGVHYKMSRAMIGGRIVVPKAEATPPFWRYNLAERQLYMSAFHISPKNAQYYAQALNHYRPDYLVGYTSSHFFLARMFNEQRLDIYQPKAVLTSSEKLTAEMRTEIENAYHCPVFDAYSGVEFCCLASECEYHKMHISPDVGIIELLDESGESVKTGEPGEIVATGLLNFDQPLIRYRTGDIAVWSDEPCPCGREMPVLKELVGRLEDTVIGPDGQETVRFHGIFVGLPHIREGQVVQETLSRFRLRLVVTPEFNEQDRKFIYQRFEDRLGPIELTLELVDRIERTERGKFRAVISKVQRHHGEPLQGQNERAY